MARGHSNDNAGTDLKFMGGGRWAPEWRQPNAMGNGGEEAMDRGDGAMVTKEEPPTPIRDETARDAEGEDAVSHKKPSPPALAREIVSIRNARCIFSGCARHRFPYQE